MEPLILEGDCLQKLKDLADSSIDMVLTDLPYGITQNKWDCLIPLDQLWFQYNRVLKKNGVIALTASQPFTSLLVVSNLDNYRHEILWLKNRGSNFANTVREPMKEHESVLIFSQGKWTYNKQMQPRTGGGLSRSKYALKWNTQSENYQGFEGRSAKISKLRVPSSWQKFNVETGLHPTQKPVPLFEYLIKTYSNPGDTILDSCAGSGTTAIACLETDRKAILIEKESKYIKVIKQRISDYRSGIKTKLA